MILCCGVEREEKVRDGRLQKGLKSRMDDVRNRKRKGGRRNNQGR